LIVPRVSRSRCSQTKQRQEQATAKTNAGDLPLREAQGQNDEYWWWVEKNKQRQEQKTKYRGLSTTAASAPPPVEMTAFWGGMGEEQATAKADPPLREG
jgi:hypothetical protein